MDCLVDGKTVSPGAGFGSRYDANMDAEARIEIRAARSGGLGIYALGSYEYGDYIHTVEYEREVTEQNPLRAELGEQFDHCAYPDGKVMLVASPGRYMNHSCDPNAYYRYEGLIARAYARRKISSGEEITVDYLINNAGGDSWRCHCGTNRCRGKTGTRFFDLPLQFQREYYPLLADWFKQRFPDELAELKQHIEARPPG